MFEEKISRKKSKMTFFESYRTFSLSLVHPLADLNFRGFELRASDKLRNFCT